MAANSSADLTALMLRSSLDTSMTSAVSETLNPVTLSSEWNRVTRLLLLSVLSVAGSVGNVFLISAIMVEDHLKKKGNAFLANLALADMLITGLVMPSSIVVILADLMDSTASVCNFQWFLVLVSCLVTVLTFLTIAIENYGRLCSTEECYNFLSTCKVSFIAISIWVVSCIVVVIQTLLDLGPDYCTGEIRTLYRYQIAVGIGLVFAPAFLTCIFYMLIIMHVRALKSVPNFRPPATFNIDYELMKTNLYAFIFFVIFWLPFGVMISIGSTQPVSRNLLYTLAWVAFTKSCFLNFVYGTTNRYFRNAYVNLFHYCCCKTISFSRRSREPVRPSGDVRVHIIPGYNMYSYTSPQRSREGGKSSGKRISGIGRPSTSRGNSREVYEL